MIENQYIDRGIQNLNKKKYKEAKDFFEDCLVKGHSTSQVYSNLAIANILLGNYEDGTKFTLKAYKMDRKNLYALNTYGFLKLRDGLVDEAVNYWLDCLDIDPGFKISKRNLERLKKEADIDKLIKKIKPETFLIERFEFNIKIKKEFSVAFVSIAGVILLFFLVKILIPTGGGTKEQKLELPDIKLPEINDYIIDDTNKKVLFNYSKNEIRTMFNRCKSLIKSKRINRAHIIINKILHSNANEKIKERFYFLERFIKGAEDYESISLKFPSFSEVVKLPVIYKGVLVRWQGKITELMHRGGYTYFKLLVNYKDEKKIDGIANIDMDGYYENLKNGMLIELTGEFKGYRGKLHELSIDGRSIRRPGIN